MRIEARGLQDVVNRLGALPAMLRDELEVAVKISVRDIKERAADEHDWVNRNGDTEREGIETALAGLTGVIELVTPNAIGLHVGRRAHVIQPREKQLLRFVSNGKFVSARRVNHPGNKPYPYLFNAAEKEEPAIQSRFEAVIGKVLQSL